jgi:hypothetical protein
MVSRSRGNDRAAIHQDCFPAETLGLLVRRRGLNSFDDQIAAAALSSPVCQTIQAAKLVWG